MKSLSQGKTPDILTIAEAAMIAGRSPSWVRRYRTFGPLEPAELDGQQAIFAASLSAMLAKIKKPRPILRIVVDNTK